MSTLLLTCYIIEISCTVLDMIYQLNVLSYVSR